MPGRAEDRPIEQLTDLALGEYYLERLRIHMQDSYLGIRMRKFPEDLRVIEQLIWECRTEVIVEVGLSWGGSALWLRDRLRTLAEYGIIERPLVVSVDRDIERGRMNIARVDPEYSDTIRLVQADIRDPDVGERVRAELPAGAESIMVIDDSAHRYDTTMATLRNFSALVPIGGYLLVEDAHRDLPGMLPPAEIPGDARGVLAAITDWLAAEGDAFVQRRDQERYIVTSNPFGWLQRVR